MPKFNDSEVNFTIDRDYGINLSYLIDQKEFITVYDGDFPRKVVLDITSWKGITAGAMHCYGELKISSLSGKRKSNNIKVELGPHAPDEAKSLQIQLTRPLRRRDLRIDAGERFKGAKLGERIKNFDSKEEVEEAAIAFFSKHFSSGWKLVKITPKKSSMIHGTAIVNHESTLLELT